MESLISNFQEIELHETQLVVKQLHSVRMLWFEQLETHLSNLYHNKLSRAADAFKPAFLAFFGAEHQTFGLKMFHNLDQLKLQFKRENLHEHECLVTESTTLEAKVSTDVKAVDAGLVVTECNGTYSDKQDTSSSSGNHSSHAIGCRYQQVNEPSTISDYDTHLRKLLIASHPDSTNMCPSGGVRYVQDVEQVKSLCLELSFSKRKDIWFEKIEFTMNFQTQIYYKPFEKHCISLEISIQQKEESFQSNKPCKNQGFPEFREFFVINDLKAQLQAKTTLICDLKNQIKSVKDASNEAKVKNDIDVIETINIELEHSVAKLLAANEQLHKENEHLKQTYKELYDSIKKTRVQNKDNNDSLISQINQKSVENADLKAQIQEKVFANAALKNELRKLKGNSVETKFAKASILGKPPLQPSRNHLVVRQPNAFTSERPRISRPRFASKVDEKNDLSKIVTPHYLPKVRESAPAKPHHVNAPSSSRNSQKESYGSNDMAHTYFLEEDRKKTEERNMIPIHRDLASARTHRTPNACIPNPRNISRNSSYLFGLQTLRLLNLSELCLKENHDDLYNKVPKNVKYLELSYKSHNTRNNNKPVEPKSHTQKPGRQIVIGQMFSLNKSSAMHEKPHTPRSCLRWKPTGRIFKTVGLRWISTGKMFTDSTTNVDSEPLNGSNDDITNPYECDQTLYFSASTFNSSAGPKPKMMFGQNSSSLVLHQMMSAQNSSGLAPQCLKMLEHSSSSLGLHCQKTFKQISSNLVSQMSQRRLLASLQAPFLKEKKGVRFSALYLQQKRNLLVLDHSHQQVSYFFHARSVVKWINVDQLIRKGNLLLDLQKLQKNPIFRISVDIRQNTNFVRAFTTSANVPSIYIQLFWNTLTHDAKTGVYSFQVDEHWLTLSADLLRKALNVTPADSAHPFESPPAGKTDITFTRRRVPSNWLMKMKFNRLLNLIWMIMSTIYNKTTRKLPVVEVKEKGSATDRWIIASQDETTGPSVHPEDATSTKMVRETLSHADAESGGNSEKINSETDTEILNVGLNSEQSHVALAGSNPEHMHDVFLATNYPKVHESLKHTTKEHVHLENPPSSSRSLSSMKNLEDS
ncbi:hypothetical protein Tco_1500107 [Tanacetum coccineum]